MSSHKKHPEAGKYEPTAREAMKTQSKNGHRTQKRVGKAAVEPTNAPTSLQISNKVPRIKVLRKGDGDQISLDCRDQAHGYALLKKAIGTEDNDFVRGILFQLAVAGGLGPDVVEDGANFMLSVVNGIKPKDQIETMLAVQMTAVHMATMRFARSLARSENIPQQDSAERALNKLARTYAIQMEALKRHRTGGEQKVTVQHVSVSEGGQAIVGNVTQTPRGVTTSKTAASPLAITDATATAMPHIDEDKERISVPARGNSRQK